MRPRAVVFASLLVGACTSPSTLLVELRTELRAGVEVVRAETTLHRGTGLAALDEPPEMAPSRPLTLGDDAYSGVRVAQFDGLARGDYLVRVRLVDAAGETVARGTSSVTLDTGSRLVTVIVNDACRNVECPGAGPPSAIACVAGRCVDPACANDPVACPPPECASDATCAGGGPACVVGACLIGFCVTVTDDARCSGGRCDRIAGCDEPADAGPEDAGPPDAGPPDAGPPDAGPPDAGTDAGVPCQPLSGSSGNAGFPTLSADALSPTWSAPTRSSCPASASGQTPYYHEVVYCNEDIAPRGFTLELRSHGSLPTISTPTVWGYRGSRVPDDPNDCAWVASGVGDTTPYELLAPGEYFTVRLGGVTTGAEGALATGIAP